jgi:hypothetical protein
MRPTTLSVVTACLVLGAYSCAYPYHWNVAFYTAGTEWVFTSVPCDGKAHNISELRCLKDSFDSNGLSDQDSQACIDATVNAVKVSSEFGDSCVLGSELGQVIAVETGQEVPVGPPQRIVAVVCSSLLLSDASLSLYALFSTGTPLSTELRPPPTSKAQGPATILSASISSLSSFIGPKPSSAAPTSCRPLPPLAVTSESSKTLSEELGPCPSGDDVPNCPEMSRG